jgi:hypothetical protein
MVDIWLLDKSNVSALNMGSMEQQPVRDFAASNIGAHNKDWRALAYPVDVVGMFDVRAVSA